MKPKKLELKNVRSLTDFSYSYSNGITGIKGPNFSGKSNFCDLGQKFSWTGLTPSGLNKKDLINWYSDKGWTKFTFEHQGDEYVLTRNIHNAQESLVCGEDQWTDRQEIRDRVENILGISMDLVSEYCFIRQFNLISVLNMNRSSRMDYFLRLVGGDQAAKLRKKLQETVNKVPDYPDRSEEIENCKSELQNLQEELQKVTEDRKEKKEERNGLDIEHSEKILSYPLDTDIEEKLKDVKKDLEVNEEKRKKFLEDNQCEEVEEVEELSEDEKLYIDYKENIEYHIKELEEQLNKLEAPEEVEDPSPLYEDLSDLKNTYQNKKEELNLIKKGKCPTCGTEFDNADEEVERREKELEELSSDFYEKKEEYTSKKEEYKKYQEQLKTYNQKKSEIDAELKQNKNKVPENTYDLDELKNREKQYQQYIDYLNKVNKLNRGLEEFRNKDAELKANKKKLEETETVTEEQQSSAEKILRRKNELDEEIQDLDSNLKVLEERKSNQETNLNKAQSEQEQRIKNKEFTDFLQETRNVFHKDNLPSRVLEDRRAELNRCISEYFENINSGFSAYLDEDFDFMINFVNGKVDRPLEDLSGGQKIILAIVFHISKLNLLPQVPFLVLDEPTMYLNRNLVTEVGNIFTKFHNDCKRKNQEAYIMIPTHENELDSCFTRIYNFGG